ncbi:MAG TPA: AAA family ATPase, partial [Accumulibacter sp.]|uniref:AAA family ATPase n=1 Tax=Accumulibacter sp. TaxID=2053492 RepID=UPI002C57A7B1
LTTGQLPFVSDDPLEIVHAHLAVVPPDPTRLDDAVPATISRIILKLMSKTPEERYQSAAGLCRDLERCASEWREKHEIGNFPLGTYDPSLKLRIPRKLYGREKDVAAMLSVFNEVAEGASALLLIAGHSGVGKSSLVHEMFLPISERRGFFLEGKFEQYRRDIPFLAWRQALDGFVRFLLRCPENELAVWRQALQQALAGNGRVMTELLPNLELIIGPQPPVTELKGQEALNRFAYVAQQFVSALAHAQHPLVIFLDDLQWIDAASLGLLQSLLSDTALTHALFVGAYRDSEVAPGDALTAAIADLESRKVNVHRLSVRNLEPGEVDSLIGDALPDALSDSASLARLVYARSGGNAFFVHQVLHLLQEGDYWDFDPLRGVWHLDQDKANALQLTDNVVDLLVEKIRGQLSADLAQFLAFAACIGNRFDLSMLDRLSSHRLADVRQVLRLAIRDAWITTDAGDFVFSHDRVQQAFYQLIPQEERQKNHLQIARTLSAGDEVPEEWIFDAANHLGHCLALVSERDERYRFSDLSRIAGEKANRTAAYETSFRYYLQAIELLPAGHWQERHAASVELFLGAAEAAFLVGRFSEMERFCQAVTAASSAVLDRIKVCEILVSGKLAQTRLQEAMDIGIAALRLLGVDFPAQIEETHWQTWRDRVGASLAARPVSALIDAPEMTDQNALMKLRILSRLLPAVYKFSPDHLPLITAEMAMASIEYGNTGLSAFGYSCHGMILVGFFADYETAWAYAHLSRAIIDRYGARNVIPRAYQIIEATIRHWKEHAAATIAPLEMAYHCGLETGDLEYASYCAEFEAIHRYLLGEPLLSLRSKMDAYAWTIEKTGQTVALNHHRPVQQAVHNLLGEAVDSATLRGSAFDESSELATLVAYNDRLCLLIVYLQKILLALVFRQPKRAGEFAIAGAQYADGAPGCFVLPFFQAYELLALIGASRVDPAFADQCVKRLIAAFSARLSAAAQQAPMNYRHLFDLVTAESAALEGRDAEAQAGYEKAIDGANQGGFLREAALACELAAEFYLRRGQQRLADFYISNAHAAYQKWQAWAKVRELVTHHPFLPASPGRESGRTSPAERVDLDLSTVLKVSQSLYSVMDLNALVQKMMRLIVENSGAQRGCLLVEKAGEWFIEAELDAAQGNVVTRPAENLETAGSVPASIVRYVVRTHIAVVLNDAAREGAFRDDSVVRQLSAKSLLCIPFISQGRVSGVLYLENNLVAGVFSADRAQLLEVLCAQAATALENSRLYDEMEQRVASRTAELLRASQEARNATELAEARAAELRRQATFIQAILDNIADGIVACDENGMLTLFNRATREMHGVEQADLPPEKWAEHYELYKADGKTRMGMTDIPLYRAFRGERPRNVEMVIASRRGEPRVVLASGQAMIDDSGKQLGAVASMHDVTEEKRIQAQLKTAKEAAEAANRAKSVFLANMSHELRTPLNAILGFSELMWRDEATTDPQRQRLDIINRSGKHLLALINDVLDMAKIEAGRVQLEIAPFDLRELTGDLMDLMRVRAVEKNLELQLEQSSELPRLIRGDETKLRQVLVNLLGNAIKFTREGRVSLRLGAESDPHGLRLLIDVEDSGPGISPQDQARIFEPFVQLEQAAPQNGTGLGLTISRQFVHLMGGQLTLTSQLGQGSCFRVELPVEAAAPSEVSVEVDDDREVVGLVAGQPVYRILIVEDQPENALLLRTWLEGTGFQTQIAENGEQGVALFQAWQPHLIWMDRRMPEMDGLEATRQIRALDGGRAVKIVAVTASVFADEDAAMLAAGIDDVLHKPVQSSAIFDCLARMLGVSYSYKESTASSGTAAVVASNKASLADLPEDLRRELIDALLVLDTARIDALVARAAEADPAAGQFLRDRTVDFEYELIEEALRRGL